ncbi:MAG: TonB-dependent receptor domain-containing protein, partial [Wenzhouxiangella sp.]
MNRWICGGLLAVLLCTPAWGEKPGTENSEQPQLQNPAAEDAERLLAMDTVVVTAPMMDDPYRIGTDPRQPRLPLPAHDGGSYLKSIPGFALSRKGGTSGDPLLRGLGGSRLNILIDDAGILGGCGMRMDPPTAYVYPEAYDRIEIVKGPQTVRYGASAAGLVRFERDEPDFDHSGMEGYAGTTVGGFGRRDVTAEIIAGGERGYGRVTGTRSRQDDYDDGAGRTVHSRYARWSTSAILGWTPDQHTRIEIGVDRSDGEAAYDDRMMDGSRFDRTGYSLRAVRGGIAPWFSEIELMLYYNYVDHVMDNFSLREPPMMPMVKFPDRRTRGGRLAAEFEPGDGLEVSAGIDWVDNHHRDKALSGPDVDLFGTVPRLENARFTDVGAFLEAGRPAGERGRITFGLRADRGTAEALASDGFGGVAPGTEDRDRRYSGFLRYSRELQDRPVVLYAGLGRAARSPDFWERRRVFGLDDEVLTQLDLGARYQAERLSATLALFY